MRLGIHRFVDEREAADALLAEGFLPIGHERTQHHRHPDRDADRWTRRADVQKAKAGPDATRIHIWRAFK